MVRGLVIWLSAGMLTATAGELEDLRRLSHEQELQIQQLEREIKRMRGMLEESEQRIRAEAEARAAEGRLAAGRETAAESADSAERVDAEYVVQPGESLARIAKRHGTTVQRLVALNKIQDPALIRVGTKLKLPTPIQATPGGPSSVPQRESAPVVRNSDARTGEGAHTIAAGDTMYRIAKRHGVSVDVLRRANPEVDPNALQIGRKLRVPGGGTAGQATKESSVPTPAATTPVRLQQSPEAREVAPKPAPVVRLVAIRDRITLGELARANASTVEELNDLNSWDFPADTPLAVGSQVYLPTAR